jgi:hypothetical protein
MLRQLQLSSTIPTADERAEEENYLSDIHRQYPLAIAGDFPLPHISVGKCDRLLTPVTSAIDVCGVPTSGLHIQT